MKLIILIIGIVLCLNITSYAQTSLKADSAGIIVRDKEFKHILKVFTNYDRLNKENLLLYQEIILLNGIITDKDEIIQITTENYNDLAKNCNRSESLWDKAKIWFAAIGGLLLGVLIGNI